LIRLTRISSTQLKNSLILTEHGFPQPWYEEGVLKGLYCLEFFCLKWLVPKYVKKIVTISSYAKELIAKCINRVNLHVVYNGVNHVLFRPMRKEKAREFLKLDNSSLIILFVGRLTKYKGAHLVFQAFRKLLRNRKDVKLLIRGNGPLLPALNKFITKYCLHERVKIVGPLDYTQLPYLYNSADVFVHATMNEMFGLTLVEAMACGVPIIASPTGAVSEVASDAPLYFQPFNVADLTNKLLVLLDDLNLRRKLSEKSIKRASCFSWEDTARRYLKIYYERQTDK